MAFLGLPLSRMDTPPPAALPQADPVPSAGFRPGRFIWLLHKLGLRAWFERTPSGMAAAVPVADERILMVLGLRHTGVLARRLGTPGFCELLVEVFAKLEPPCWATHELVAEWLGSQVLLSWPVATGAHDSWAVQTYFALQAALQRRESIRLDQCFLFASLCHGRLNRWNWRNAYRRLSD